MTDYTRGDEDIIAATSWSIPVDTPIWFGGKALTLNQIHARIAELERERDEAQVRAEQYAYQLGQAEGDVELWRQRYAFLAMSLTWTECDVAIHENPTGEDADDSRKHW